MPPSDLPVPPPVPPARLSALADGVFAIAMTLLVLQLGVPVVTAGGTGLGQQLVEMWPEFLMYVLSFLVLGVFWLIHHILFDTIDRYDTTLAWLNIAYLMFAALIPFATGLIVEHGAITATALFYGTTMLALFTMGWGIWTYATTGRRLSADHVGDDLVRGASAMGLIYIVVLVVPLGLAFVSPMASMIVYGCIALAFIGFTVVGRGETVTVWRGSRSG